MFQVIDMFMNSVMLNGLSSVFLNTIARKQSIRTGQLFYVK